MKQYLCILKAGLETKPNLKSKKFRLNVKLNGFGGMAINLLKNLVICQCFLLGQFCKCNG